MASQRVQDILDEYSELKYARRNWEDVWEEIVANVVPHRTGFKESAFPPEQGERRDSSIYDGTPLSALNLYASGSQGYLLSSNFKWFGVRVPMEELMNLREVRLWLSHVEQVLMSLLQRSNFYSQMFELFRDGGSFGTATLFMYWDKAASQERFMIRHPREVYLAENQHGKVDTIDRRFWLSARNVVKRFPDGMIHDEIRKQAESADEKHNKIELLHCVKPNPDYDPERADARVKQFTSYYVDIEHAEEITRGGYDTFPYATWRVEKNSDEDYGRGPGWTSLSDIKALHAYAKTDIRAAHLNVNPPLDIPEERLADLQYVPGGRNYYAEASREVRRLMDPVDVRPGLDREERRQQIIERNYMIDFFLMMALAEREMTATEIRQRREEKAVMLGPHITLLNQDVLDPIIDKLFDDAWEAGLIRQPPDILQQASDGELEIDYQGPLATAQRQHFQQQPYRQLLNDLAGVAQLQMGTLGSAPVMDNFDLDYIIRQMAKASNVDEEAIAEERSVRQLREIRARQQQRQQQLAAMEQAGKAVPGLNEPVQEGSVLDQMQGATALAG